MNKQTIAIITLVIVVIGLTATAVTKFVTLEKRTEALEVRIPEGYKQLPIGSIVAFHGLGEPPKGWLLCNGKEIPSGMEYETLRERLKDNKTPDLQGMFLRGAGQNGVKKYQYEQSEPRLVGSSQEDATALPKNIHTEEKKTILTLPFGPVTLGGKITDLGSWAKYDHGEPLTSNVDFTIPALDIKGSDEETRPSNYAVNFIIKAF